MMVGSLNRDQQIALPVLPRPDETVLSGAPVPGPDVLAVLTRRARSVVLTRGEAGVAAGAGAVQHPGARAPAP